MDYWSTVKENYDDWPLIIMSFTIKNYSSNGMYLLFKFTLLVSHYMLWLVNLASHFPLHCMLKLCLLKKHLVWVIDQAWGQDGWILAKFFFCVFMDLDFVSVHKHVSVHLACSRSYAYNKLLYSPVTIWIKT